MSTNAILKQLEDYKKATAISAEWSDLVSAEEIAQKTFKTIKAVKDLLSEKGIQAKAKLGKTYLYSKSEILKAIRL